MSARCLDPMAKPGGQGNLFRDQLGIAHPLESHRSRATAFRQPPLLWASQGDIHTMIGSPLCRQLGSGNGCGWLGVSPSNHMKQPTSLAPQDPEHPAATRLRRVCVS